MSPFEIAESLRGMVVLVDTREQDTPRLRRRLKQMDCPNERKKLEFGDYSARFPLPDGSWMDLSDRVAVERKMSMDELAQCYTRGRPRFEREFLRAAKVGAKLYLLIEGGSWEQAYAGAYRTRMAPSAFVASMTAWLARYHCQLLFCEAETTGRLIRELLYREGKERMERGEVG